jgi:hypothetical protein
MAESRQNRAAAAMVRSDPISNHEWPQRGEAATKVAQSCTLLYRRFAIGRTPQPPRAPELSLGPQVGNLRYSRLKICATRASEDLLRLRKLSQIVVRMRTNRSRSSRGNEAQTERAEGPKENSLAARSKTVAALYERRRNCAFCPDFGGHRPPLQPHLEFLNGLQGQSEVKPAPPWVVA